ERPSPGSPPRSPGSRAAGSVPSVPRLPFRDRLEGGEGRELALGRLRVAALAIQPRQEIVRVAELGVELGRLLERRERLVPLRQEDQDPADLAVDRGVVREARREIAVLAERLGIFLVEQELDRLHAAGLDLGLPLLLR